jgi:hypothetical protein
MSDSVHHDEQHSSLHCRECFCYDEQRSSFHTEGLNKGTMAALIDMHLLPGIKYITSQHLAHPEKFSCCHSKKITVNDDHQDATILAYLFIPKQLSMFRAMSSPIIRST